MYIRKKAILRHVPGCGGGDAVGKDGWSKQSDRHLVERIRKGERGAWDILAERYYDEIFRYCWYRTGNESAAADCTQETFLHMIQGLAGYADEHRFRAWAFRIASNVCMDYFRRKRAVCVGEEVLEAQGAEDRALGQAEDACYVEAALLSLTEAQREAVILKFYHGFKIREIAQMLGISLAAAKGRLKQGMDRLKDEMESGKGECGNQGKGTTAGKEREDEERRQGRSGVMRSGIREGAEK